MKWAWSPAAGHASGQNSTDTVKWWEASGAATFNGACARPPRKRCMTHATTWPETPLLSLDRHVSPPLILYPAEGRRWRHGIRSSALCRCRDRIGIRRLAADRRHKGSRTPTPRTVKPWRELARAPARIVAYRGSNGPLLLTKQAQHSTGQYYPYVCIFQCFWWLEMWSRVLLATGFSEQ